MRNIIAKAHTVIQIHCELNCCLLAHIFLLSISTQWNSFLDTTKPFGLVPFWTVQGIPDEEEELFPKLHLSQFKSCMWSLPQIPAVLHQKEKRAKQRRQNHPRVNQPQDSREHKPMSSLKSIWCLSWGAKSTQWQENCFSMMPKKWKWYVGFCPMICNMLTRFTSLLSLWNKVQIKLQLSV